MIRLLNLILLFLFLPYISSHSQDFPIPSDGAQWNNEEEYLENIQNIRSVERIEVKGDTLIDGNTYYKLYKTWQASYYQTGICEFEYTGSPTRTNTYRGAIRTNSNQRVLYIAPNDTLIRNLYDFSLDIGDTLYINGFSQEYTATVTEIDSIVIKGEYRKQYTTIGYLGDRWIEGIGSEYGLFGTIERHWEKYSYDLSCYQENGIALYQKLPDSGCYRCNLVSSISDTKAISRISVQPNPVVNQSNIEYPTSIKPIRLNIYNAFGAQVYTAKIEINAEVTIDRQYLNTGTMILELVDINDQSFFQKIVVL